MNEGRCVELGFHGNFRCECKHKFQGELCGDDRLDDNSAFGTSNSRVQGKPIRGQRSLLQGRSVNQDSRLTITPTDGEDIVSSYIKYNSRSMEITLDKSIIGKVVSDQLVEPLKEKQILNKSKVY